MNTNDKQRMIEDLRARLQWLTFECEKEDTDAEVKAIIDLLDILDPIEYDREYYSAEKSLERFWASERMQKVLAEEAVELAQKEATEGKEEEKVAVLAGTRLDSEESSEAALAEAKKETIQPADTKESLKKVAAHKVVMGKFTALHKVAVAVILIAVMFLGGTIGAYAEKRGFFHAFGQHDDREEILTTPEVMDTEKEVLKAERYYDFVDVPDEYIKYIWEIEEIPSTMEFACYEIVTTDSWCEIVSLYENDASQRIGIYSKVFYPLLGYYSVSYDAYELCYKEEYNNKTIEYGTMQTEDEPVQIACWTEENVQYSIKGEVEFEQLSKMIKSYIDYVDRKK